MGDYSIKLEHGPAARLVVVGDDSHRLHEEIITAGGLIKEGRLARMNVTEVERILAQASNDEALEPMHKRLLAMWKGNIIEATPKITQLSVALA